MDGQTVDFSTGEGLPAPVRVGVVDGPRIDWSPAPPVRVVESRAPRSVREIEAGVWRRRFRPERFGWIRLHRPRPRGHHHNDRLRRARRPQRRPLHLPPRLRAAGRATGALRTARRGRRRPARRCLRAPPHRSRIPVRAPDASRRSAGSGEYHDADRAHRPPPDRHLCLQRRRPQPSPRDRRVELPRQRRGRADRLPDPGTPGMDRRLPDLRADGHAPL